MTLAERPFAPRFLRLLARDGLRATFHSAPYALSSGVTIEAFALRIPPPWSLLFFATGFGLFFMATMLAAHVSAVADAGARGIAGGDPPPLLPRLMNGARSAQRPFAVLLLVAIAMTGLIDVAVMALDESYAAAWPWAAASLIASCAVVAGFAVLLASAVDMIDGRGSNAGGRALATRPSAATLVIVIALILALAVGAVVEVATSPFAARNAVMGALGTGAGLAAAAVTLGCGASALAGEDRGVPHEAPGGVD